VKNTKVALLAVASWAVLAGLPSPTFAQTAEADQPAAVDDEGYEVEELVVTAAGKPRGSVVGDIPPEITLSPREIRSLGVGTVAELIEALEPQTGSSRGRGGGRPIMLLNGMRISSFSEIRDLPTEAISRVEILPEEVALKYGYRADQRVVNIVLRQRFRATTVEAGVAVPTAGGRNSLDADVGRLGIQQDSRLQLDLKASRVTPLFESERDLIPSDDAAFRTLTASSQQLSANAIYSRPIREGVGATVNGLLEFTETEGQLGRSSLGRPLRRMTDTVNAHLGLSANGGLSDWRWSFTGNADRNSTDRLTQRDAARSDSAQSVVTSADAQVVFNGTLMEAPAGEVSAALTGGLDTRRLEAKSFRGGVERSTDLSRHIASAQANVDVPIAERLSLNGNAAVDELSDFGTMLTVGAGVNWSPVQPLRVIASVTQEDGPPTIQQLGDPEVLTPAVRVFDYLRGETVEVAQIEGGNPNLAADQRRVFKLGLTYKPFEERNLTIRADYTRSTIEDAIAAFPSATPEIQAAFPERFVRDDEGRLVQVDVRPVNFAREESEQIRWGFNYSKPLGPQRPPGGWRGAGQPAQRGAPVPPGGEPPPGPDTRVPAQGAFDGPGGGPGGGGFGGRGFGGGMRGGGALQFAVFHTYTLKDEILIREGVPVLDLLNGSATGNGGGQPRHEVDVQAGYSKNGYGARLNAKWRSGTTVDAGPLGGEDLIFSDLTTVNLRLFADLGMQPFARSRPWLRGMRATLSVDNVFDERQDVRTAGGVTPVNYQPDYIDPVGRTVRFTLRKLFFSFPGARPAPTS